MLRSVVDTRLGGKPKWRVISDDREAWMRLPDEVQKCVVFFGKKVMDRRTKLVEEQLGGTGFFVALPVGVGAELICLVTAAHVAKDLNHGPFFIRANTKDGTSKQFWLDAGVDAHWIFHPTDDSVDVAVLLWVPPPEVDFLCIPEDMFLPKEKLANKGIGVGDETYVTGLFHFHTGKERNEPIIRSGSVAMMPTERIPVSWHKESGIEGYLIEGRSIGGFSGSPVFVQRSIKVHAAEVSGREPLAGGAIFWLGLMHGHWNVSEGDVDTVRRKEDPEAEINAGVAIVVPCHKILEVLNHEVIQSAAREGVSLMESKRPSLLDGGSPTQVKPGKEKQAARYLVGVASASLNLSRGVIATPVSTLASKVDTGFPESGAPDNPEHKEHFTSLLNAAARKKPQGD